MAVLAGFLTAAAFFAVAVFGLTTFFVLTVFLAAGLVAVFFIAISGSLLSMRDEHNGPAVIPLLQLLGTATAKYHSASSVDLRFNLRQNG
jgi:hypothetical protein